MPEQDRSFFLKYHDYSNGMRLTIRKEPFVYRIEHNAEAQGGDHYFDGSFEGLQEFHSMLKELYPRHWNEKASQGEHWFLRVFQELFHQVERYKRKYPAQKAQARRRKTPHKK